MEREEEERLLRAARPLIELAVAEDIGPGDATSNATLAADTVLHGRIVAKASGVVAGLSIAAEVFHRVDPAVAFVAHVADGQEVVPGELIAQVTGPARSLLAAERIALNFLGRLSGIATLTRCFADAVACTPAAILDTRKTLPGYRLLDKYAVRVGGGQNHRLSLYDMILIKDNHLDAAGGVLPAIDRARSAYPSLPIEVEVRDLAELRETLQADPALDRIMLDNMSLEEMRQAVVIAAGRVLLEASGNVTLERVAQIAATGVDYISVGALTHSVEALDLSMEVTRPEEGVTTLDLNARLAALKSALGGRLVILGHHYQRDEVIAWADLRGDSLKLAREATQTDAQFIIFCGVHFMAETAAVLARPDQRVFIPDATAGCYLADTATLEAVQAGWDRLAAAFGDAEAEFTPVTYVNSSAALKAFCGRHGGIVCTSGNAGRAVRWALERRPRVFFFPDQHLGRNTARRMGIPLEAMLVWDGYYVPDAETLRRARVVLWPGCCNVHQRFRPEHVQAMRQRFPGIRILVHPECKMEVVDLADDAGSTAHIINQVEAAPGTQWAIGTESRLVHRLQREHPGQRVIPLADVPPFCRTMGQITSSNLAQTLEALASGQVEGAVVVEAETARWARLALERMLAL
ncbi:MAG: quinolinate synthase NadA [Anaerolineae bacterium]|nr:MAG: quinolinate synthase NadA [Anaerolineae bacterium]